MDDMSGLTAGLLVFAGVQVLVLGLSEWHRRRERRTDRNEAMDRAFHIAWAEHFRLEGLSDSLGKADLIELAVLGVLRPVDVLPREPGRLIEALAGLSREAGVLGGIAVSFSSDVERNVAIFVSSVSAFASDAPLLLASERVQWIRQKYGDSLATWEQSIPKSVSELSRLYWDAAVHNPRIAIKRELNFSDNMSSGYGEAAAKAMAKRAAEATATSPAGESARGHRLFTRTWKSLKKLLP